MTKREAASYLRLDVSAASSPVQAVDRLIAAGHFTTIRMGRVAMLHVDDLDAYIERVRSAAGLHQ